jgi:hypothetical protein
LISRAEWHKNKAEFIRKRVMCGLQGRSSS